MLRHIAIENFKGIGDKVAMDLKPVTLLFGPNSAGKSTILHALHFLHALLDSGNADVEDTRIGGAGFDLGGFANFVHDRDLARAVTIQLTFEPDTDDVIAEFGDGTTDADENSLLLDYDAELLKLTVYLHVGWSEVLGLPLTKMFTLALDGVPLCGVFCSVDGAAATLFGVNIGHGILRPYNEEEVTTGQVPLNNILPTLYPCLPGRGSALPWPDRDPGINSVGSDVLVDTPTQARVSQLLRGSVALLKRELERFRYVGPIRQCPPRNYQPPRRRDEGRWANGLGAWDAMTASPTLTKSVSEWLSGDDRFASGYRLESAPFREVPENAWEQATHAIDFGSEAPAHPDLLAARRRTRLALIEEDTERAFAPGELGEGISQVIPVIAAAFATENDALDGRRVATRLVAIEQPELHIHPRMQVALGDLFLANKDERQFIIETHSEHLVLRLLRRIRETTANTLPPEGYAATVEDVAVLYVNRVDGQVRVKELRIAPDGDFLDEWPDGFFIERRKELF